MQGLHSASIPGILALDISRDSTRTITGTFSCRRTHLSCDYHCLLLFVGGADKNAVIFHKESEQIVSILKGHTKKVTGVIYHPGAVSFFLRLRALHGYGS